MVRYNEEFLSGDFENNFGAYPPYPAEKNYRLHYEPWYDDTADYNTNAKSYYDYLARFNHLMSKMPKAFQDAINRALNRDVDVKNTDTVTLTKDGDWKGSKDNPNGYDDLITLSASTHFSDQTKTKQFKNLPPNGFTISNGSENYGGVWSPDYGDVLNAIDDEMGRLTAENQGLRKALQKLIDNLYNSGALTSKDLDNFDFKDGRNIATGNINFFGGKADGNSFIRTNNGKTENDVTAGIGD